MVSLYTLHLQHNNWSENVLVELARCQTPTSGGTGGDTGGVQAESVRVVLQETLWKSRNIRAISEALCHSSALVIAFGWEEFFEGLFDLLVGQDETYGAVYGALAAACFTLLIYGAQHCIEKQSDTTTQHGSVKLAGLAELDAPLLINCHESASHEESQCGVALVDGDAGTT